MKLGPITDLVTELVGLVDAYHRALNDRGGPGSESTELELAIRHGRVLIAMRTEIDWTGVEADMAVAA